LCLEYAYGTIPGAIDRPAGGAGPGSLPRRRGGKPAGGHREDAVRLPIPPHPGRRRPDSPGRTGRAQSTSVTACGTHGPGSTQFRGPTGVVVSGGLVEVTDKDE
jgi:hypothetical protein